MKKILTLENESQTQKKKLKNSESSPIKRKKENTQKGELVCRKSSTVVLKTVKTSIPLK